MLAPVVVASVGSGLVMALTSVGLAWHECLLLAGGAVASVRLFLIYMDSAAPWDGWRAAISCISAGVLIALSGLGLALWTVGVWMGWLGPAGGDVGLSLPLLGLAALVCCALRRAGRWHEAGFWLPMLALAGAAAYASGHGLPAAPCLLALVGAAALLRTGWQLASQASTELMRADASR